jgi:hypothetical protein
MWLAMIAVEDYQDVPCGGKHPTHLVDDLWVSAGPCEISHARMLRLCIGVDVNRDHAAMTKQIAQVSEEQRTPANRVPVSTISDGRNSAMIS